MDSFDEEEGEIRKEAKEDDGNTEPEEGEVSEAELDLRRPNSRPLEVEIAHQILADAAQQELSESSEDEEESCRAEREVGLALAQRKFGSLAALDSRPAAQITVCHCPLLLWQKIDLVSHIYDPTSL
jgi:hypothetical protein